MPDDLLAVSLSRKIYDYSIPLFADAAVGFNNSGEIVQLSSLEMFNTFTANTCPLTSRRTSTTCRHFRFEYWAVGRYCHAILTNLLGNKL